MTDLQKQIEELEQLANSTDRYTDFEAGIDAGCRDTAETALSIIRQLQHELSCWQHTQEESKEWIRQLQKERDQALADYNMARDALTKQLNLIKKLEDENNAYIECLRKINSCDDSSTQQSREAHNVLKQFGKL